MTKADLVERVTAQISRTAGPMIPRKTALASSTHSSSRSRSATGPEKHRGAWLRHLQDSPSQDTHGSKPTDRLASGGFRATRPVFKPSKELRAMVAGIDISELEDDVEEMTEA
jgi:integration host factor subunit beta